MLGVASGTFLHDIRVESTSADCIFIRVNSNYVVIFRSNENHSTLYVHDLKRLKESDPSQLLLTTIDLKCQVKKMLMNETRIVCLSDWTKFVKLFIWAGIDSTQLVCACLCLSECTCL